MGLIKKILTIIKDILKGLLYPGFAVGFMLLLASALFYFQPFDYFSDQADLAKDPERLNVKQTWRLFKLGLEILAICAVTQVFINSVETWWEKRPKKESEPEPEAPKEAA